MNRSPPVGSGETENVRRDQGGRKQLFSPAQPPYLLSSEPIYVLWDDDPVRSKWSSVDAYLHAYGAAAPVGGRGTRVAAR